MTCQVSMIFASDKNSGIGFNNKLPWDSIPEDMEWFKQCTMGKTVVMGRKTWESLPERFRPLPGRTNVVLTSNTDNFIDAIVSPSIEAVLERFKDEKEIVVIGGGEVYKSFAPYVTRVYQTNILDTHRVDVRMEVECDDWDLIYFDARKGQDGPIFQIFEKIDGNEELIISVENILPL